MVCQLGAISKKFADKIIYRFSPQSAQAGQTQIKLRQSFWRVASVLVFQYAWRSPFEQAEQLLRPDLIPTQGPKLFEVEYGGASHSNSGGAHACQ
jgi:hypothetical protein